MHTATQFIKENQTFEFTIEFENLSSSELSLLVASLQPEVFDPEPLNFTHRIGLGKSLGLGMVNLNIKSLKLTDAKKRYSLESVKASLLDESADCPQFHSVYNHSGQYNDEDKESGISQQKTNFYPLNNMVNLKNSDSELPFYFNSELIDEESRLILIKLGSVDCLKEGVPVSYPLSQSQTVGGDEGFKWFVNNDKTGVNNQCMDEVNGDLDVKIPTLKKN